MAKPSFDDGGSSCHLHSSLWSTDAGGSLMPDATGTGMSERFRWYLGGLLATAREFALLLAPTVNSYRRFLPESWAPTAVGWDVDNRTLGFRVVGRRQHFNGRRIGGDDHASTFH